MKDAAEHVHGQRRGFGLDPGTLRPVATADSARPIVRQRQGQGHGQHGQLARYCEAAVSSWQSGPSPSCASGYQVSTQAPCSASIRTNSSSSADFTASSSALCVWAHKCAGEFKVRTPGSDRSVHSSQCTPSQARKHAPMHSSSSHGAGRACGGRRGCWSRRCLLTRPRPLGQLSGARAWRQQRHSQQRRTLRTTLCCHAHCR